MSTCPTTTRSHFIFLSPRSSSTRRQQSTSSESCDRMPVSWLLAYLLFKGLFLLLWQLIFVHHHFSTSNSHSKFPTDWFFDDFSNKNPSCFRFPLFPHAILVLLFYIENWSINHRQEHWRHDCWENDNATPVASAAKQSLLQLIPYIVSLEDDGKGLYRLVLVNERGDLEFTTCDVGNGMHSSLLSDLLMAMEVDMVTDEDAAPFFTWVSNATPTDSDLEKYTIWAKQYFMVRPRSNFFSEVSNSLLLFNRAPDYKLAGKDARHIWFAPRDWRGEDPEGYFGRLGNWAVKRMNDLGMKRPK